MSLAGCLRARAWRKVSVARAVVISVTAHTNDPVDWVDACITRRLHKLRTYPNYVPEIISTQSISVCRSTQARSNQ